jgi:hypothetical protein
MQLMTPEEAEALRKYGKYLEGSAEENTRVMLRCVNHLSPEFRRVIRALWWLRVRLWLSRAWDTLLLLAAIGCMAIAAGELIRRFLAMEGWCR